jgi:hypothetical protein
MRSGLIYVLIAMVVISFSSGAFAIQKATVAADQAHVAVCSLKTGYVRQLHETNRYLADPKLLGKVRDSFGITRANLVTSRDNLRKRVHDLRKVDC